MSRRGRRAFAFALALTLGAALFASPACAASQRRVLLVLVGGGAPGTLLDALHGAGFGELALITASLGNYNQQQTLLDITQGARVPRIDYSPQAPAQLELAPDESIGEWNVVRARAKSADAGIEPGLLAGSIPGGAAYAAGGAPQSDAVLAAGRSGRIAQVSVGSRSSLLDRVATLLKTRSLVVADLNELGLLRALRRSRRQGELLLVLERPPATAPAQTDAPKLLALAAAGLGARYGALSTKTTRIDGLVTPSDLGPTIVRWLRLHGPSQFSGQPITVGAPRSLGWFGSFAQRLGVIQHRRTEVLLAFLAVWMFVLVLAFALRRDLSVGLRVGGLAALWAPAFALLSAAIEPSAGVELALIVGGAFAVAAVSDRLVPWPRAPAVPVALVLVLYALDLARGAPLIETSLVGSDPISGARFFGAGNELAALLPVALFAGLAAALPQRAPGRREVALFAAAGALLTVIVAWGRLGANVGAIFTIGGGSAVATALLLPGGLNRRRVGLATLAIAAALGLLAALDLISGDGAQFTRQVIHAHSLAALFNTLGRRLSEAWSALFVGAVLPAVLACLAFAVVAFLTRRRLLAPVGPASTWAAALGGGFAGALLGSVANDSGPRLLLVGCGMLICVLAYLRGAPPLPRPRTFLSDASRRKQNSNSGPASPGRTRPFCPRGTIWR